MMALLHEVDWPRFGEAIAIDRMGRGMSVRDVTAETGVSIATLSRAEHGQQVGASVFLTLCDWADLDPFEMTKD